MRKRRRDVEIVNIFAGIILGMLCILGFLGLFLAFC